MNSSAISRSTVGGRSLVRRIRPVAPQGIVLTVIVALAILFLYTPVASAGTYRVTIGALISPLVLIYSFRRISFTLAPLLLAVGLVLWPLLIFFISNVIGAELTPPYTQFLASFSLWAISISIIGLAFLSRSPLRAPWVFSLNVIMLIVCAIQVLVAGVFGSLEGYDWFRLATGVDIYTGYVKQQADFTARAIGLSYEPSMCARIIGTLCFIDILQSGKTTRNIIAIVLGLILTKSLGLLVLAAVMGIVLFARSSRQLTLLVIAGLVIFILQGSVIANRLQSNESQGGTSSTYRRTIGPLDTVGYGLSHYPAGIPIGANVLISEVTNYAQKTGEERITNGTYEFILYFGVLGIAIVVAGLAGGMLMFLRGERELSAAILYLLLSTALSGSFLAIESSLLTYFFVTACLASRLRIGLRTTQRHTPPPRRPGLATR